MSGPDTPAASSAEWIDLRHALAVARGGSAAGSAHEVAQRLGESAFAALLAAMGNDRGALVDRAADLLDHLLTMWAVCGVAPEQVWAELDRRRGVSGHAEKAARGPAKTPGSATNGD